MLPKFGFMYWVSSVSWVLNINRTKGTYMRMEPSPPSENPELFEQSRQRSWKIRVDEMVTYYDLRRCQALTWLGYWDLGKSFCILKPPWPDKMNDSKELQWFSDGLNPFATGRNIIEFYQLVTKDSHMGVIHSKTKSTSSRTPPYGPNKLFFHCFLPTLATTWNCFCHQNDFLLNKNQHIVSKKNPCGIFLQGLLPFDVLPGPRLGVCFFSNMRWKIMALDPLNLCPCSWHSLDFSLDLDKCGGIHQSITKTCAFGGNNTCDCTIVKTFIT